jgi:hypothetical protein
MDSKEHRVKNRTYFDAHQGVPHIKYYLSCESRAVEIKKTSEKWLYYANHIYVYEIRTVWGD